MNVSSCSDGTLTIQCSLRGSGQRFVWLFEDGFASAGVSANNESVQSQIFWK